MLDAQTLGNFAFFDACSSYGSEGWGFESLQVRQSFFPKNRPIISNAFLQAKGFAQTDARKLGPDVIEDYKAWRASMPVNRNGSPATEKGAAVQRRVSPKTLQFEVQTVGTFLKHGVRLGLLPDNPVQRVQAVRLAKKAPVYLARSCSPVAQEEAIVTATFRNRRDNP